MRRFRFGVQVPRAGSRAEWVAKARRAEALGYATFLMPDHLGDYFAPAPALVAAADATTTLRVGSLVFANDFRHPVLLAKEAATVDLLSDGRFELGLGAGWLRAEYDQAGIVYDPPPVRIGRLAEAVQLIKRLFGEGPVTFSGRHYRVTNLTGSSRPVQRPHPPLLIGGGGRQVLSLAAREATIVGIGPRTLPTGLPDLTTTTAAATDQKVAWLRYAAGERFDGLELSIPIVHVDVTYGRRAAAEQAANRLGLAVEHALETPYVLIGTVEQIIEKLRVGRERHGISYVVVWDKDVEAFAPVVERLAGR